MLRHGAPSFQDIYHLFLVTLKTAGPVLEICVISCAQALSALGLKAGGTPLERAERLLLAKVSGGWRCTRWDSAPVLGAVESSLPCQPEQHNPFEAIPARHFAKSFAPPVKKPRDDSATRALAKAVAWDEAQVARLCELLAEPIAATQEHVEKKAALTFEEMAAERDEVRQKKAAAAGAARRGVPCNMGIGELEPLVLHSFCEVLCPFSWLRLAGGGAAGGGE